MTGGIDPAVVLTTILTTYVFGTLGIGIALVAFVMSVAYSMNHNSFHATKITSIAILLWFGARTIWNTAGLGS